MDAQYTAEEFRSIVKGYGKLDQGGHYSALLKEISRCELCRNEHKERSDHPVNLLARPLPLQRLLSETAVDKYYTRIKRMDTFSWRSTAIFGFSTRERRRASGRGKPS